MRMAAQIDLVPLENVLQVIGVERVDERVLRFRDVDVVIALNRLVQEREPDQQHQPQQQQKRAAAYAGFHRKTGLRAAVVSSTRLVRVRCGADFTSCGSVSTSWAM